MKIRKLTTLDVIKVANILQEEILEAAEKIGVDEEGKRNYRGIIKEFINSLLIKAEKGEGEALEWFASLANMTTEEFLKSDPITILNLVEALTTSEEMKDFFDKAQKLLSKLMEKYGK